MENDFTECALKVTKRSGVRLAVGASLIALLASFAAEQIPSEHTSAAVFTGQVLSDELIQSLTNVYSAKHGLFIVDDLRLARIRVESVIKHDEPIPLRFPDEVSVYYFWNENQQCPRPVRLATSERKKFYCSRHTLPGLTNVLFVPAASHATAP